MVKLIAILVSIQLVFFPAIVVADEKPVAADVRKGQKAPFSGTLLNPAAVAKILAEKQMMKEACEINTKFAVDKEKARCKRDYDFLKSKSSITEKKLNKIIAIKNKQIKKTEEIAIRAAKSNRPWLWAAVGAAAGVAATIGMVFLVRGTSE